MVSSSKSRLVAAVKCLYGHASLAGLLFGLGYWIIEAGMHAVFFDSKSFTYELFHGSANELWMRSFTFFLFIVLGCVIQWYLTQAKSLELQMRRLARAVENAGEAILITDLEGRIEYANPAFSKLTGYDTTEIQGLAPSVLKSGAHNNGYYHEIWTAIKGGRVWSGSIVDRRKNGTYFPALLTIAPVADNHGMITHFVGVQHDMTRQVELEEQLRHAEKLGTLGTVVGGVAHDLNNTLGILEMQLDLAVKNIVQQAGPVDGIFNNSRNSLQEAIKIASDLSQFARRGSSKTLLEPLELRGWLDRMYPVFRLVVPGTIQLRFLLPDQAIWIRADGSALQQAAVNILQNARDALAQSPGGDITISCELVADARTLNPDANMPAGTECAVVRISDNGPGIDPVMLDRIFEPFFTTKGDHGSGLGLATARDTASRHGGTLRALNHSGKGATFELMIPRLSLTNSIG